MTEPRPGAARWTEHDENVMVEMLKAGKTAVEISLELKRTRGAVYSRLQRLYRRRRPHEKNA